MADEQQSEQPKVAPATSDSDNKILAAVSYLWVCSVIIYILKKDNEYIKFHAQQGMVIFAVSILGWFLVFVPLLPMLVGLGTFVLSVIGAVKAYQGEKYKFPVIGDLAEKINF